MGVSEAYQIWNDRPVLQFAREHVRLVKAPDIEMCGYGTDIEIVRCDFTWKNWSTVPFDNCARPDGTTWLTAGPRINDHDFCYLFSGSDKLFYGDNDQKGDYLQRLGFYFQFKNMTGSDILTNTIPVVAVQLLDPDFNPLWNKTKPNTQERKAVETDFRLQRNNFGGVFNQSTIVKMFVSKLQEIKPHDISSVLGLTPSYINTTIISRDAIYYPLHESEKFGPERNSSGFFQVEMGSFTIEVQTQKRVRTILGALGIAGGAFGIIFTIYYILYGDRKSRPWGLMHRMMRLNPRDSIQIHNVPLISPLYEASSQELTQEERIACVEDRIEGLEGLLSEYCFDTTQLKRLSERIKDIQQSPASLKDLEAN
ncbi:hypothetical protein G9A89_001111 [Geosiphon pyriformis]|nr:hypothetical protein G9A89_001111 [Geosiphon pyriformis]